MTPLVKYSGRVDERGRRGIGLPLRLHPNCDSLGRVPGSGPVPCDVMLVGERPGKDEPVAGAVFVGLAGMELSRYLRFAQIDRKGVYITNVVKDFRYGEHPTPDELARDAPLLEQEIAQVNPRVIVPMGAYAIHYFLGDGYTVDVVHGAPRWDDTRGLYIFPTFHPAAGFYDGDAQPAIMDDFSRLGKFVRGELPYPEYTDDIDIGTVIDPAEIDQQGIDDRVYGYIPAIDTEGSTLRPWCLTYCSNDPVARLIKGDNKEVLSAFQQYVDSVPFVYLHNSPHDLAVLRGLGVRIGEGKFRDTMVLAYLLGIEPQGLKNLAYRHTGKERQSYGELTEQAAREKCLDYLAGVAGVEWPDPDPYFLWDPKSSSIKQHKPQGLNRRVANIFRDLESGKVNKSGEPVDPIKRWNDIEPYLREPAELLLGELWEATLDDIPYERALEYACTDAIDTRRIAPILERGIQEMGLEKICQIDHACLPIVDRMMEVGFPVGEQKLWDQLVDKCSAIIDKCKYQIEKMTGARINLDSGDQVAELLFGQLGLKPKKMTKGKVGDDGSYTKMPRGSTDLKSIQPLVSEHPVVPIILEGKHASKVKSSFGLAIPRYSRNSRIHATINSTRVITGRYAAKNPNLLAIPVRTELGKEIRNCFEAAEGRILSSHDLDQAEMRMMAHESGDSLMCEVLSDPRRDIHSETGALMFGIKTSWEDKYAGVDKMRHRYPAKRVGFGVITGITGVGLKDQMDLAGATQNGLPLGQGGIPWTEDKCTELIEEWFRIYPGARAYMDGMRHQASEYGYIKDWAGRIRYLPGVHSPIRHIREEALRQSHSHSIQAGAQSIIKIAMAEVWEWLKMWRRQGRYAEMLLQIHDELIHEWEDGDPEWLEETNQTIINVLQNAVKLRVPMLAKGSYGKKWGELKD